MGLQRLNRAPAGVSHNIIAGITQHSTSHRAPRAGISSAGRGRLWSHTDCASRHAAASKGRSSWARLGGCSHDNVLSWDGSTSSEAPSINRPGRGHSRSLYLVLGDGLILAASPSQLTLGVELPNFLDQDVLALSSSPNCAQPPSHQKRDRVKIARLCLLLSARLFFHESKSETSQSVRYCTRWRDSAGHHPYPPQF